MRKLFAADRAVIEAAIRRNELAEVQDGTAGPCIRPSEPGIGAVLEIAPDWV
jgi:hypothetical protein